MIEVDLETITTGFPGHAPLAQAQLALKTLALPQCPHDVLGLAYRAGERAVFPFLSDIHANIAMLLRRDQRPIPPHIARVLDQDLRGTSVANSYTALGNGAVAFHAIWQREIGAKLAGFLIRPLSALVVLAPEGDLPPRGTLILSDLASGHEAVSETDEMAREFKDHLVFVNRN